MKRLQKHLPAVATLSLAGLVGMPALSQSRQERVDEITSMLVGVTQQDNRNQVYTDARTGEEVRATPQQLMRATTINADFDQMPVKLALEIWSDQTNVPLVLNWKALENAGIDPNTPITLKLDRVPAEVILKLIISQMQADAIEEDQLIIDLEPWFVRVQTKREALRRSTTKIYFIGDLLMTVPNFEGAPGFSLNEALSNTNSGGSDRGTNNGGEGGLFDEIDGSAEREPTKAEKAQQIVDMIRETIEPDIWRANGGEFASVRYLRGMLVVKAPDFVHEQIGLPSTGSNTKARRSSENRHRSNTGKTNAYTQKSNGNVAGVAPKKR